MQYLNIWKISRKVIDALAIKPRNLFLYTGQKDRANQRDNLESTKFENRKAGKSLVRHKLPQFNLTAILPGQKLAGSNEPQLLLFGFYLYRNSRQRNPAKFRIPLASPLHGYHVAFNFQRIRPASRCCNDAKPSGPAMSLQDGQNVGGGILFSGKGVCAHRLWEILCGKGDQQEIDARARAHGQYTTLLTSNDGSQIRPARG